LVAVFLFQAREGAHASSLPLADSGERRLTVSKLPQKDRPTNADLQKQVAEVHGCLENVGAAVDAVSGTVKVHSQQLVAIADAMGVRLPTEEELKRGGEVKRFGRRVGGLSTLQAGSYGVGIIVGALSICKMLEPSFAVFGQALRQAILGH
jgi:hypothetical protein